MSFLELSYSSSCLDDISTPSRSRNILHRLGLFEHSTEPSNVVDGKNLDLNKFFKLLKGAYGVEEGTNNFGVEVRGGCPSQHLLSANKCRKAEFSRNKSWTVESKED